MRGEVIWKRGETPVLWLTVAPFDDWGLWVAYAPMLWTPDAEGLAAMSEHLIDQHPADDVPASAMTWTVETPMFEVDYDATTLGA